MKNINIAVMGMGTVGSGVYKVIELEKKNIEHKEGLSLNVKKVLALDYSIPIPEEKKAKDINEIVNDPDISVVVEVMGGIEPARTFILQVLKSGKTVVTANKELIARNWPELEKQAKETGAGLYFEASVGGGIPILRTVYDSLQANSIHSIYAIINGTTNYILTKMSDEGMDFDEVLKEAQELGYAEANPTNDVDGFDAMYKLSILSSLAFHARIPVEFIYREGIRRITKEDIAYGKELGFEIKLLAIGKKGDNKIEVRVHPTMIPKGHPLATVKGSFNAIFLDGSAVGELMLYGKGAGDMPTASAIVSDIIYSCNISKHKYVTFVNENQVSQAITFENNWQTEFFVRINVQDKPGVLAKIAGIFGKYGVSLQSVIQKGAEGGVVPLILVSHKAREISLKQALDEINLLEEVIEIANYVRVER